MIPLACVPDALRPALHARVEKWLGYPVPETAQIPALLVLDLSPDPVAALVALQNAPRAPDLYAAVEQNIASRGFPATSRHTALDLYPNYPLDTKIALGWATRTAIVEIYGSPKTVEDSP